MPRPFMIATLTAILLMGAAQAQDGAPPEPLNIPANSARADGLIRGESLAEADLYSTAGDTTYDWAAGDPPLTIDPDWDEIGEVEDIVLDSSGELAGILVEVGGFLGLGEKSILIPLGEIRLIQDDDAEPAFVTRFGEELLEEWPEVEDDYWE